MTFSAKTIGMAAIVLSWCTTTSAQMPYGIRFYRHASTAGQGYFDGAANFVGARAHAALMYRQAQIAHEQARLLRLENRLRHAQDYYARRYLHDEYAKYRMRHRQRDQERQFEPRPERDDIPVGGVEPRVNDVGDPSHRGSEGNQTVGARMPQIPWPTLLAAPSFDDERMELEWVVSRAGAGQDLLPTDYQRMRELAVELRRKLQRVDDAPEADRFEADCMLVSVIRRPRKTVDNWVN